MHAYVSIYFSGEMCTLCKTYEILRITIITQRTFVSVVNQNVRNKGQEHEHRILLRLRNLTVVYIKSAVFWWGGVVKFGGYGPEVRREMMSSHAEYGDSAVFRTN